MDSQPITLHQRRGSIRSDGRRDKVRVADVHGRFTKWRKRAFLALIVIYAAAPMVRVGGKPLIFLDILNRRFFLFGRTFNAQDAYLIFFLLAGGVLAIFLVTSLLGRLWCGWACPQTVFLEGVFRPIERWLEGSKHEQVRLAKQPMNMRKLRILATKHAMYLVAALVVSHIFISYFVSLEQLREWVFVSPREHWTAFVWMAAITGALYFDFAWFREQTCLVLCPYGRLQSALTDEDTVVIGYDAVRGEPRGSVNTPGAGDCVDCFRCVEVCPTAIDIREGLQMECIGCAACIDACDDVMARIGRPLGLVRYDSLTGLAGGKTRMGRAKIYLYAAILAVLAGTGIVFAYQRKPFEATLIRQTGAPYVLEDGAYRNQYFVHIVNKTPQRSTFEIRAVLPEGATAILPIPSVELDSLTDQRVPVIVSMPADAYEEAGDREDGSGNGSDDDTGYDADDNDGTFDVVVETRDRSTGLIVTSQLQFIGP
ncbi:MAG: cytochrome c oxidase accessory protein CcoG [Ardenticatenales bacterium]|nr:cytochrome c oxidase accessory protein CcoG [Ardenticatenales bacterium]